jgi:DNA invertase Pin-like site-specific DNA recombinase
VDFQTAGRDASKHPDPGRFVSINRIWESMSDKPHEVSNMERIGYARVSTDDQHLDLQRDALTKAGCGVVYEEKASGKSADRPELAQALKALRAGDTLTVWRLDRLGRSLPDLVCIVFGLEQRGIGFESLTERIDTTSATGRLTFHLFAALAEFERNLIRERTQAGLAAARARGRKGGRRPKLDAQARREIDALLGHCCRRRAIPAMSVM